MEITRKEIDAIRFYQGDVRRRNSEGKIIENSRQAGVYGIKKAYRTMNCLMFDDINNEQERIAEENGELEPKILIEIETVIEVFCDIYRVMCKYVSNKSDVKKGIVYRTERGCSIEALKKGYTNSYMSTSQKEIPANYFRKKRELIILNIEYFPNIPHVVFREILGDEYLHKEQQEVLFPPFLEIELEQEKLSQKEKMYRDIDGKPPCAKYNVKIKNIRKVNTEAESDERKSLNSERNTSAARILQKLIQKEKLRDDEKGEYINWKRDVRAVVWKEVKKIEKQYFHIEEIV